MVAVNINDVMAMGR